MIETRDLTKMYGDLYALNRLNMKLEKGDVYGFIGPNGAGKTPPCECSPRCLIPLMGKPPCVAIRSTPVRKRFAE